MNVTFTKVQGDWLEASYKDDEGKELAFVSYHPTQMDLITADMLKHGVEVTPEDESMLEKWVASYIPPTPEPEPEKAPEPTLAQLQAEMLALMEKINAKLEEQS